MQVDDFLSRAVGRAVPYGIYDLAANAGWLGERRDRPRHIRVRGTNHPPSAAGDRAVRYPDARHLVIPADGGRSNGSRVRLWKRELQALANEIVVDIKVHHFPPGTSKCNKVEHRLFSFISMNWRATPLVSYRVIADLIGASTTDTGLVV